MGLAFLKNLKVMKMMRNFNLLLKITIMILWRLFFEKFHSKRQWMKVSQMKYTKNSNKNQKDLKRSRSIASERKKKEVDKSRHREGVKSIE
jgi:hypothetical protein